MAQYIIAVTLSVRRFPFLFCPFLLFFFFFFRLSVPFSTVGKGSEKGRKRVGKGFKRAGKDWKMIGNRRKNARKRGKRVGKGLEKE